MLIRKEGILVPNLDFSVVSMMEEAKWMQRLGVKVPTQAHSVTIAAVKQHYDQLKVCVSEFHLSLHL